MTMNRRAFLWASSSVLALAGIVPPHLASADAALDIQSVGFSGGLTRAKFAALVNQTFYVRDERLGTLFVKLIEIRTPAQPANPDVFSLFFQGPALPVLPAGMYALEHYLAVATPIYLEPAPIPGSAPLYRADFCLLN